MRRETTSTQTTVSIPRSEQREKIGPMDRDAQKQCRLAVLELVHAADEEAPGDQTRNGREDDTVDRVQCRPAARTHSAGKEVHHDVAVSDVAPGKKANTAIPQASSVIS